MDITALETMYEQQLIPEDEFKKIKAHQVEPTSVHWDLRTLLYLGIILFTTAAGILIYKNIEVIGHQVILIVIAAVCIASFAYCFKCSSGYSNAKVAAPDTWFDYVLLLGCLLLLTFIGYIQFEYNIFGNRWGLALLIPMVLLFIAAYYFDHLGVLSLAITNLAAWAGISVTPLKVLRGNDFGNTNIIYTGLILGIILTSVSFIIKQKNIKAHFGFTYKNFGSHLLFISLLALMFYFNNTYLLWFMLLAVVSFFFFKDSIRENSFYFLVVTLLYTYVSLSYVVVRLLSMAGFDMMPLYLGIIYFIVSGIGLIRLFMHYNKIIKNKNAGLQ